VSGPPEPPPLFARTFAFSAIRESLKGRHLLWMLGAWVLLLPELLVAPYQTGPFATSQQAQLFLTTCVLVWGWAIAVFVQAAVVRGLSPAAERPRFPWAALAMLAAILGLVDSVFHAVLPSGGEPDGNPGAAWLALAILMLRVATQVLFLLAPAIVVAGARAETALLDSLRLVSKQFWWVFVVWMLLTLASAIPSLPVVIYYVSTLAEQAPDTPVPEPPLAISMVLLTSQAIFAVCAGIAIARAVPLLRSRSGRE